MIRDVRKADTVFYQFGNNYLLDNYIAVQTAFQLSVADWNTICENSIRGSWCSDTRKAEMLAKLKEVVDTWLNHIQAS